MSGKLGCVMSRYIVNYILVFFVVTLHMLLLYFECGSDD